MTKPLRKQTVHQFQRRAHAILELMGKDISTLCGKTAAPTEFDGTAVYTLTDSNGNQLRGTMLPQFTTCQKCKNLLTIGALHVNTPHARRRFANDGIE